MSRIALLAPLAEETAALLRRVKPFQQTACGAFRAWRFTVGQHQCLLVESGMGLQQGVSAADQLLREETPELLICYGIAGGVRPGLEVGDLVVGREVRLLDSRGSHQPLPLPPLPAEALAAIRELLAEHRRTVHEGTLLTARAVLKKEEIAPLLPAELPHPLVELETWGVAKLAAARKVPLLALRGVHEPAEQQLAFSVEEFTDAQMNLRPGKLLWTLLRRPRIIPQLLRISRQTGIATELLADCLVRVLRGA